MAAERKMASASLWPILGAAGIGLARAASSAVSESLSFAAELARGSDASGEPSAATEPTAAEREQEQLRQRIEALAARIKQQLAAAGVDVTQPLVLTSDGLGGITAAEHPQRAAIESLLESDVLLLRDFERLKDEYAAAAGASSDFSVVVSQPTLA
jgi:hypothetical protein